jgi:hypothetical protein
VTLPLVLGGLSNNIKNEQNDYRRYNHTDMLRGIYTQVVAPEQTNTAFGSYVPTF